MAALTTGPSCAPDALPPSAESAVTPQPNRRPRASCTAARDVSPTVARPSMSPGISPASVIAARAALTVIASPDIAVLRPIRDIPIPEMNDRRSKASRATITDSPVDGREHRHEDLAHLLEFDPDRHRDF